MTATKQQILDVLQQHQVDVLYFNDGVASELWLEEAPEIALAVSEADLPKWQYFTRRLNESVKVAESNYLNGIYKFLFVSGAGIPVGAEGQDAFDLFLAALQKQYFKVAPKIRQYNLLVKPTHACNLDCLYCYDKPFRMTITEKMSMDVLDRLLKLVSEYAEVVQFIWHGGEPTTVGTKWYEYAYENVISKYPMLKCSFSMMSNGTLLDDSWLELAKKYDIEIGVSYNAFHQTNLRVASQNKDDEARDQALSDKVLASILKWRDAGRPLGVIDVITGENYKDWIQIYEFYKKLGMSPALNRIFHTANTEKNDLELSGEAYTEEFLKYFKHWLYDADGVYERTAIEALAMVVGDTDALTCIYHDCRKGWTGVNPRGEFYPCDRYFPERYKLATVWNVNSIEEVYQTENFLRYSDEIDTRLETICAKCDYHEFCEGGCNGSAYEAAGTVAATDPFFCATVRGTFNGVYKILRSVDLVHDKLNPHAKKLMVEAGFYSVKEIRRFMKEVGFNFPMKYDANHPMRCSEYAVFRGINYNKHKPQSSSGRHTDFYYKNDAKSVILNEKKRRDDLHKYLKEVAENAFGKNQNAQACHTDGESCRRTGRC